MAICLRSKLIGVPIESALRSVLRASVMPCYMPQRCFPTAARSKPFLKALCVGIGMMTVRLEVGGYGSSRTR